MTESLVGEHIHDTFFANRPEAVGRERFISSWVEAAVGLLSPEQEAP